MTLDQLKLKIENMAKGQFAEISYSAYDNLFPPGEPDEIAREVCYNFAKSLGCRVENKPGIQQVWIVKDA